MNGLMPIHKENDMNANLIPLPDLPIPANSFTTPRLRDLVETGLKVVREIGDIDSALGLLDSFDPGRAAFHAVAVDRAYGAGYDSKIYAAAVANIGRSLAKHIVKTV